MVIIGNTLISEAIFDQEFICNLSACKGACCVEGDSGAPATPAEKERIENELEKIKPYLTSDSLVAIQNNACFEKDDDEEWVTTCLPSGECNFSFRNVNGILSCGIEQSFLDGKSNIRKPISCYLYPIRVSKIGDYTALNYHSWDICSAACALGKQEQVAVYQFLKDPLIERFGKDWYNELCEVAQAYRNSGIN